MNNLQTLVDALTTMQRVYRQLRYEVPRGWGVDFVHSYQYPVIRLKKYGLITAMVDVMIVNGGTVIKNAVNATSETQEQALAIANEMLTNEYKALT